MLWKQNSLGGPSMRLHPEPPRNFTWNFPLPKTSLFPQNIQNFSKPFEFSQLLNFSQNLLWHISRTILEPAGTSRTNFTKFPKNLRPELKSETAQHPAHSFCY